MYPPLPTKLVEIRGNHGIVETGGERYPVDLRFLDAVYPGDYILVEMGFGIQPVGKEDPAHNVKTPLTEIRKQIEKTLEGTECTVLLTSGILAANPDFQKIRYSLPPQLHFAYGPGCPACLTPAGFYRNVFQLTQRDSVILVTFDNVMNMPTPGGTLQSLRMAGNDVRLVHSPYDVLRIAEWNPSKEIVLAAVGYDIMAATIGMTLKEAMNRNITNLSCFLSLQKRDVLMRDFILRTPHRIDGVVCSAYDVVVAGTGSYKFVADELKRACSCSGFAVDEILLSVLDVIRQSRERNYKMEYRDSRDCSGAGNERIQSVINEAYELSGSLWITGETIEQSRYVFRNEYRTFDAEKKFDIQPDKLLTMPGCNGREVQLGLKIPSECPHFATNCTPDNPVGAGMLTFDGLCHTWYHSSVKLKNSII